MILAIQFYFLLNLILLYCVIRTQRHCRNYDLGEAVITLIFGAPIAALILCLAVLIKEDPGADPRPQDPENPVS